MQLHLSTEYEEEEMYHECYIVSAPRWWTEAFANNIVLPNLKEILLDTAFACIETCCSTFGLALTKLLSTANINVLTVKHLQDSCLIGRPDFKQLPITPSELHLLMGTFSDDDACPGDGIEIRHRLWLFNRNLNAVWLFPMQSQLTHLTIHVDTYWGVYPRWQPINLHFPYLKSLAFGQWTIAFDWQIDFITSHGQTLEQLILSNCPILHVLSMTQKQISNQWRRRIGVTTPGKPPAETIFCRLRWHTVLPELRTKLTKLKHFAMGRGLVGDRDCNHRAFNIDEAFKNRYKLTPRIDRSCYALFDYRSGPLEWTDRNSPRGQGWLVEESEFGGSDGLKMETDQDLIKKVEYPDCLQEDQVALESLLRTLDKR